MGVIKNHNSLTNKARDLWNLEFYSSSLALSTSINLKSLNSFKLYLPGNLDTPFYSSNGAGSRLGNIWANEFDISINILNGHNFVTNNARKVWFVLF